MGMKGEGFYDAHSEYQQRVIAAGTASIREAVASLMLGAVNGPVTVADYGAGTGSTSVSAVHTAIRALRARDGTVAVVAVHNDLPTSDLGSVLELAAASGGYLDEPGPIYSTAAAGSFFGQVVPDACVQLGLCSNASHWLRRQPDVGPVDGMYFSAAQGPARQALALQAAEDWQAFLAARAAELAPGGRFVVQGIATEDSGQVSAAGLLEQMWTVALALADDELLDPDLLAGYVFPVYCRSEAETVAPLEPDGDLVGQLTVVSTRVEEIPNPYWEQLEREGDRHAYAKSYADFVRAFSEGTLMRELFVPAGRNLEPGALCDEFFDRFERATATEPSTGRYRAFVLSTILARQ
jgi:hypothetical protein